MNNKGKLILSTKSSLAVRKAVIGIGGLFFIVLAILMIANSYICQNVQKRNSGLYDYCISYRIFHSLPRIHVYSYLSAKQIVL